MINDYGSYYVSVPVVTPPLITAYASDFVSELTTFTIVTYRRTTFATSVGIWHVFVVEGMDDKAAAARIMQGANGQLGIDNTAGDAILSLSPIKPPPGDPMMAAEMLERAADILERDTVDSRLAQRYLERQTGGSVPKWNDEKGRTKYEVIDALRMAAKDIRNEHTGE